MSSLPNLSALTLEDDARSGVYVQDGFRRTISESRGSLAPDTPRDGKCLFHCLSRLKQDKTTEQVIKEVRDHLSINWDRMAKAHSEKSEKDTYLEPFAFRNRWGGSLEIDAAAEMYKVNIFEWFVFGGDPSLTDEQALRHASLSSKYRPAEGSTMEYLKSLPSWDLFWHKDHYRYLEKETSQYIHGAAAAAAHELPFTPLVRPKRVVPKRNTMNEELGKMAAEREARERVQPAQPSADVCHLSPVSADDEATDLLVRQLAKEEEQIARDAEMAQKLHREWSSTAV